MEKSSELKSDGLEVVSIGALYNGPLDKKYWSSSRGRDRYPYPIGYQAVKITNVGKFGVQIHEGIKGPVFMIYCSDGRSCSGQTPDIACQIMQKKGLIHMKMLNEKRSMRKIDGVEFFGFKNPFVQRLFRELVANVNGAAEQNLLSPSFCNGIFELGHGIGCPDSMQNLNNSFVTQRTSNHHKKTKELSRIRLKKALHSDIKMHDSSFKQEDDNKESHNSFQSPTVSENELNTQNQSDSLSYPLDNKTSFDRLEGDNMRENTSPTNIKIKDEADPFFQDGVVSSSADLFVPDTDVFPDSDPHDIDKNPCDMKDNSVAGEAMDQMLHDSEGATHVNIMDSCSEKNDSFDQEFTKSMMSVLLPQALPLLKYSRKRKKGISPSISASCVQIQDQNINHSRPKKVSFTDGMLSGNLHVDSNLSEVEFVRNIIPDSFENEKCNTGVDEICPCSESNKEISPGSCNDVLNSSSKNIEPRNVEEDCHMNPYVGHLDTQGYLAEDVGTTFQNSENDKYRLGKSKDSVSYKLENKNSLAQTHKEVASCRALTSGNIVSAITEFHGVPELSNKGCIPLSESIILRNFQDNQISEIDGFSLSPSLTKNGSLDFDTELDVTLGVPSKEDLANKTEQQQPNCVSERNSAADISFCAEVSHDCDQNKISDVKNNTHCDIVILETRESGTECLKNNQMDDGCGIKISPLLVSQGITEFKNELSDTFDLLGCYVHPFPVTHVLLSTKDDELFVCALCECTSKINRMIFFYRVSIIGKQLGLPVFIGHISVFLPHSHTIFGKEVESAAACFQLTPDARYLVIGDKIRVPHCREQRIDCSCSACNSDCYKENTLKIVQLERGFASVVEALKIKESLVCVLVCGPDHLVAAGENGGLHLWVMNFAWREMTEEFVFPTSLCIKPCISELKKVPRCNSLIVGHNSYGEFGLWDVAKRVMVSRFTSSPGGVVSAFVPVGAFTLDIEKCVAASVGEENDLIDIILNSFQNQSHPLPSLPLEDIALCILLRSVSDPCSLHPPQNNPFPQWRLGLLANSMLLLGPPFDPRAAAVGSAQGRGVIGTSDGLVYLCDIATGAVPGTLHRFRGGEVSCIEADPESWRHPVAVAGEGGRLLIYIQGGKGTEG